MTHTNKQGMAIPVVLCVVTALLILGLCYSKTASEYTVVNPTVLLNSKLEILGEGITNVALLKFKELPSDFYYAYEKGRISSDSTDVEPITVFESDSKLRGSVADPDTGVMLQYKTAYKILSQKKYDKDVLVISVEVSAASITRVITKTIATNRRRDI